MFVLDAASIYEPIGVLVGPKLKLVACRTNGFVSLLFHSIMILFVY